MRKDSIIFYSALIHIIWGLALIYGLELIANPVRLLVSLFFGMQTLAGAYLIASSLPVLFMRMDVSLSCVRKLVPQQTILWLSAFSVFQSFISGTSASGPRSFQFLLVVNGPIILLAVLHTYFLFDYFIGVKWILSSLQARCLSALRHFSPFKQ